MELSLLNLLLVLLAAWIAGSFVARIGYPAIFGELMVGIILGPPLLGILHGSEALSVIAELGVLLMMLYIGMEIDAKELFKASWGGFLAAIGGFVTPFVLAFIVVTQFFDGTIVAGLFVGIAAGVTSLATKSRILADLKLLDTRIAHVMMAGALIADSLSLVIFAAIISLVDVGTLEASRLLVVGVQVTLFFGATIFMGLKVFPLAWTKLSQWGLTNRTFYATFLLLITLLFAELAEIAGLHAILGAFLAGLFIREGIGIERRLAGELTGLVRDISIGFLAPVFFVTAGFHVSLDVFTTSLPLLLTIIGVATIGKIAGTAIFYLFSGNGWREGITIGAGMNGRGAVEIIIAEIALSAGIISQEIFSVLVFMAIFTTATVPVFLKWGTDWLQRRGELQRSSDKRVGTVIIGAGPTARAIAKALMSTSQPVWLIDKNMDHCQVAQSEGLNALFGDALDEDNLREARLPEARWFLALTSNTETNILATQLARNVFSVPEAYALLTRTENGSLLNILSEDGAYPIYDHDLNISEWDEQIKHNEQLKPAEVQVSNSISVETMLEELRARHRQFLPLAVTQNGQRIPFVAVDTLKPGDALSLLEHRQAETNHGNSQVVGAVDLD
jgi:Kef-type K+ transport system membrane component KefB/Trk K+ transport system NAD-binding subunit